MFFSWIGFIFLGTDMSNKGNEEFANNLKEGVYIFDEDGKEIKLRNQAAIRINKRLLKTCSVDLECTRPDKAFMKVDYDKFKNQDYENAIKMLTSQADKSSEKVSMKQVVESILDQ